jgi:hypothetical protein
VGFGADPRTTLSISWATAEAVSEPVVDIGTDGRFGRTLPAETRLVPGWGVRYHHVTVDALEPGTTYQYRCRHHGVASTTRTARTAPAGPEPFTFAAYGDQGTDARAAAMARVMGRAEPAFAFCLGDLCYADPSGGVLPAGGIDHRAWDRWSHMMSRALAGGGAVLPVVGNDEIETGMGEWGYDGVLARFAFPTGGVPGLPVTWTVRYGNVALVAADANDVSAEITRNNGVSGGAQESWLEATLAGLRADPEVDWIVVGFHHCAYGTNSLHGSDSGVRRWASLFDRFGVDLVVNGHNHCYERTHPLQGGEPAAGGVTYLCAGGGGGTLFPMSASPTVTAEGGMRVPEDAPWSAFSYAGNSVVLVDVAPPNGGGTTALTVRAVGAGGWEVDRVTLLRQSRIRSAAPAA